MDYTENDLPVTLAEAEMVTLADGTQVRFEESGGARDVFVGDEWTARATLFPGSTYVLEVSGGQYTLEAEATTLRVTKN